MNVNRRELNMDDKNINDKQGLELTNNQLWDKAATNEPITRNDLNINDNNNYGLQNINEGFYMNNYNLHSNDMKTKPDD